MTTDYIGPDRRNDSTRASDIETIEVPNVLRAKVDNDPAAAAPEAVEAALEAINMQKLQRHDFQIGVLVAFIVESYEGGGPETRAVDLDRLLHVTADLSRRIQGTAYAHISSLCQALARIARSISAAVDAPPGKDVKLLDQTAMAIHLAFDPETDSAAVAADIATTIGTIKKRGRH